MKNTTFENFPDNVKQIYFGNVREIIPRISLVELNFLNPFTQLKVLSLTNLDGRLPML